MKKHADERGTTSIELLMLFPVLLGIFLLVIAGGRLVAAENTVAAASRDAARAASRGSLTQAQSTAQQTVEATVAGDGISCHTTDVTTDTSQFRAGGFVSVDVRCHVPLADLALLRLPAEHVVTAHAVVPIDQYRMVN